MKSIKNDNNNNNNNAIIKKSCFIYIFISHKTGFWGWYKEKIYIYKVPKI